MDVATSGPIRTAVATDAAAAREFPGILAALEHAASAARDGAAVGLHTGPAPRELAERMCQMANPGQVLLSEATTTVVLGMARPEWQVVDLGEHRLPDLIRTQSVAALRADGSVAAAAPPRSMDVLPNNLPVLRTSFVGREADLIAVQQMLTGCRLLSIVGPPGVGKTRLALHLAGETSGEHREGGAWFVDLTPATAELVPAAVARGVRISELPGQDPTDTVAEHFGTTTALVVLDNCEHVLGATGELATRLIARCPGLRLVAASRESLQLAEEAVFRLAPLAGPAAEDLFTQRAWPQDAGALLDPTDRDAITEICAQVDGLPLAIELAAARCRFLTPRQLADQLADRRRVLAGGPVEAPERHRTLAASIAWSVDLLGPTQQALLRRLSVFSGGFDLSAAEAVCAGGDLPQGAVLDAFAGLVDHCLVDAMTEFGPGAPRYRLLVSIRDHALGLLVAAGEEQATRRRHAEYFVAFTRTAAASFLGPDRARVRELFAAELDNVRAADDWAADAGEADLAQGLAFREYWLQEHPGEGLARFHRAAAIEGGSGRYRSDALIAALECAWGIGEFALGARLLAEGVEDALARGDDAAAGEMLAARGWAELFNGDPAAEATLTRGFELLTEDKAYWKEDALFGLGFAALFRGDGQTARDMLAQAEAMAKRHPSMMGPRVSAVIAYLDLFDGDLDGAAGRGVAARRAATELVDPLLIGLMDGALAWVDAARGDDRAVAAAATAHAEALARRQGFGAAWALLVHAVAAAWTGSPGPLSAATEEALAAEGLAFAAAWCMALRAERELAEGDRVAARATAAAAVPAAEAPYAGLAAAPAALASARVARADGDLTVAEREAQRGLAAAWAAHDRLTVITALEVLGGLAVGSGAGAEGTRLLASAAAAREAIGFPVQASIRAVVADDLTAARAATGGRFDVEWAAGAALSLAEAVEFCTRGRGPRRRPSAGWDSLTPTELEVVRLCAAGRRNQDIADALLMSVPTVKTHLRRVFAKLDVSSRAELAALAARRT